jgi:hypothetical protein
MTVPFTIGSITFGITIIGGVRQYSLRASRRYLHHSCRFRMVAIIVEVNG